MASANERKTQIVLWILCLPVADPDRICARQSYNRSRTYRHTGGSRGGPSLARQDSTQGYLLSASRDYWRHGKRTHQGGKGSPAGAAAVMDRPSARQGNHRTLWRTG